MCWSLTFFKKKRPKESLTSKEKLPKTTTSFKESDYDIFFDVDLNSPKKPKLELGKSSLYTRRKNKKPNS